MQKPLRLRPNVCIVIRKQGTDRFLLCHRKGYEPSLGWQFPQGGIDKGKDLVDEMKRELREEIGTDNVTISSISQKQYSYVFPTDVVQKRDNYDGQIQTWILVDFKDQDSLIHFDNQPAEFDAYKWVDAKTALENIVHFKKDVYNEALHDFGLLTTYSTIQ